MRAKRRGGVYIAVLGVTLFVTVIGLSAMLLVESERETRIAVSESRQARTDARSAMEIALSRIAEDRITSDASPSASSVHVPCSTSMPCAAAISSNVRRLIESMMPSSTAGAWTTPRARNRTPNVGPSSTSCSPGVTSSASSPPARRARLVAAMLKA